MTISNASVFFDLRCRLATGTATTVGGRTMILLERAERKRTGARSNRCAKSNLQKEKMNTQEEENREDSFLGRFRMMLREELRNAKSIVPFQPETTFPQQSQAEDNAALAFWTLSMA